tara:strand:- start:514 stop:714 length:201 start_codon:yes stop_codon:yes gene_type:complete
MGDIFSKREIIKFEKVVLNPEKLPILAKFYIGFLNKVLNIPKFVDIACIFLVSTINMYSIKRKKNN